MRLEVATHAATSFTPAVGVERDGIVYELFGNHAFLSASFSYKVKDGPLSPSLLELTSLRNPWA